jgi:phospholipase/carboxylesterase
LGRLIAVALLAGLGSATAVAAGPELATPPPAAVPATPEKRSGVLTLAGGAYAYLPKGMTGAPAPLLVAFYGAGGQASDVLASFRADADRDGFVLLIPTTKGATWDMIQDLQSRFGIEMKVTPRYGKDLKALDAALADLFARVAIDPRRIGMMGFSNGATYALSVGTANPQLVSTVIAFSPGPAFLGTSSPTQRIFISHGEQDEVLPYSYTRGIVARIRVRKIPLMFEPFKGGHTVPKDIRARALAWFNQR